MNKWWSKKTRPPKTLKCSKSKTIRNRKRKSSHRGDLKRLTWCELVSFLCLLVLDLEHFKVLGVLVFVLFTHYISIKHLCCKNLFTHFFLLQNMTLCTFLLSGKFCTPKSALESFQFFCLCFRGRAIPVSMHRFFRRIFGKGSAN